ALTFGCATSPTPDEANAPLAPRRAVIPRLSGELELDGKLDEAVWRRAAVLKPFFPNRGEGRDSEATEVRLWYDDTSLHLGWVCTDRDIQATLVKRDSTF